MCFTCVRYAYDTDYPNSLGKNHEPFSLPSSPMRDAVNIVALYDYAMDQFYYVMVHDTIDSGSGECYIVICFVCHLR